MMKKKHIVVSAIFIGIFLLVSCLSQENMPNSSLAPTLSTTSSTSTETFTQTMDPLLATNAAGWAKVTESINATVSARGVSCPELYQLRNPEDIIANSNNSWTVYTCSLGGFNLKKEKEAYIFDTFVASTGEKQIWVISHEDSVWSDGKSVQLASYKWTLDGKYLYLTPVLASGGDGVYPSGYFWDNYGLYRLNLVTGKFENILLYSEKGYSFSLSPNDKYLAYSKFEDTTIHIQNMNNDEEQLIHLEDNYALTGAFTWNVDSSSIIFASAMKGWENENGGISIYRLAINNLQLKSILSRDQRLLIPFPQQENGKSAPWSNEHLLYVISLDYLSPEYFSELALDIQTGEIVILATPEPWLIETPTP